MYDCQLRLRLGSKHSVAISSMSLSPGPSRSYSCFRWLLKKLYQKEGFVLPVIHENDPAASVLNTGYLVTV